MSLQQAFLSWLTFLQPLLKDPDQQDDKPKRPPKHSWELLGQSMDRAETALGRAEAALVALAESDDPMATAMEDATAEMLPTRRQATTVAGSENSEETGGSDDSAAEDVTSSNPTPDVEGPPPSSSPAPPPPAGTTGPSA
jgi:hypothetical protein